MAVIKKVVPVPMEHYVWQCDGCTHCEIVPDELSGVMYKTPAPEGWFTLYVIAENNQPAYRAAFHSAHCLERWAKGEKRRRFAEGNQNERDDE